MSTGSPDPPPGRALGVRGGPDQGAATTQRRPAPVPSPHEAAARTYDAPHRPAATGRLALFGILALVAVAGIVIGLLTATGSHAARPPAAAVPVHHAAAPSGHLLATLNGTGLRYSAPFPVSHRTLIVRYSYHCAGGPHPFTVALAGSRSITISRFASAAGTGTSRTATIHLRRLGTDRVAADSACPYQVRVYQP